MGKDSFLVLAAIRLSLFKICKVINFHKASKCFYCSAFLVCLVVCCHSQFVILWLTLYENQNRKYWEESVCSVCGSGRERKDCGNQKVMFHWDLHPQTQEWVHCADCHGFSHF